MFLSYYPPSIETKTIVEYYENQNPNNIPGRNISNKIKIIKQLNDFSQLKENWDSYGASTISKFTIDKAIEYVKFLYQKNIEVYYTAPSPIGDILLELRNKNKTIEIEVLSNSKINFSAYENDQLYKCSDLNSTLETEILNWYLD